MATATTTYSFSMPAEGGDDDVWGGLLNDNWDALDDFLTATFDLSGAPAGSLGFIKSTIIPNPITERVFFAQSNRPQVSIKRSDTNINATLRFFGTTGLGVEAGMGDNGVFTVGADGSQATGAGFRRFWVDCSTGNIEWTGAATGDGSGITDLDATELNGVVPAASMPTDSTERDRVLTLLSGASVGAVGTYAFLSRTSGAAATEGDNVAGSGLRYSSVREDSSGLVIGIGGATPSGTWKCMGQLPSAVGAQPSTLFLRVA